MNWLHEATAKATQHNIFVASPFLSFKSLPMRLISVLLVLVLLTACRHSSPNNGPANTRFDARLWAVKEGDDYPYRKAMLQDVALPPRWRGLSTAEVMQQLGQPNKMDSAAMVYHVEQKRLGFFPLHLTALVFKLDSTGHVKSTHIFK